MYNKSKVMRNAWMLLRKGYASDMSDALKQSWKSEKARVQKVIADRANGIIPAAELNIGDTVAIEYGDYNNNLKCTITAIRTENLGRGDFLVINALSGNMEVEFCPKLDKGIQLVNKAAAGAYHAA